MFYLYYRHGRSLNAEREVMMEEMGMTDKQFNGYVRFLLDALQEAKEEPEREKLEQKLDRIIDNLQKTLED